MNYPTIAFLLTVLLTSVVATENDPNWWTSKKEYWSLKAEAKESDYGTGKTKILLTVTNISQEPHTMARSYPYNDYDLYVTSVEPGAVPQTKAGRRLFGGPIRAFQVPILQPGESITAEIDIAPLFQLETNSRYWVIARKLLDGRDLVRGGQGVFLGEYVTAKGIVIDTGANVTPRKTPSE